METRVSRLEGAYEQVADRLNAMDRRLDSMDRHIADLRQETHQGFAAVDRRIEQRFAWMMGGIATSWVTTMLAIFFHR